MEISEDEHSRQRDRMGKAPEVTHAWCVHQMMQTQCGWSGMKRRRGVGGVRGMQNQIT